MNRSALMSDMARALARAATLSLALLLLASCSTESNLEARLILEVSWTQEVNDNHPKGDLIAKDAHFKVQFKKDIAAVPEEYPFPFVVAKKPNSFLDAGDYGSRTAALELPEWAEKGDTGDLIVQLVLENEDGGLEIIAEGTSEVTRLAPAVLKVTLAPPAPGADTCAPNCVGKECGDDGCGGLLCGTCKEEGQECSEDGQCVEGTAQPGCTPDCDGKFCGSDGCDGDCGTCPSAAPHCTESGQCVEQACDPSECEGKLCSDTNSCGDHCATVVCADGDEDTFEHCFDQWTGVEGHENGCFTAEEACAHAGRECGEVLAMEMVEGAGVSCGGCDGDLVCSDEGQCVTAPCDPECGDGEVCVDSKCETTICAPGEIVCNDDGTHVQICNDLGTGFLDEPEDCGDLEVPHACVAGDDGATCECQPDLACEGKTCDAESGCLKPNDEPILCHEVQCSGDGAEDCFVGDWVSEGETGCFSGDAACTAAGQDCGTLTSLGGSPVKCWADPLLNECDDQNPCTADTCGDGGTCSHAHVVDGAPCVAVPGPGQPVEPVDICIAGVCSEPVCKPEAPYCDKELASSLLCNAQGTGPVEGQEPTTCAGDNPCVEYGGCDEDAGTCIATSVDNGEPCGEANVCIDGGCTPVLEQCQEDQGAIFCEGPHNIEKCVAFGTAQVPAGICVDATQCVDKDAQGQAIEAECVCVPDCEGKKCDEDNGCGKLCSDLVCGPGTSCFPAVKNEEIPKDSAPLEEVPAGGELAYECISVDEACDIQLPKCGTATSADGQKFDCPADVCGDFVCDAENCKPQVCEPLDQFCGEDGAVYTCDSQGLDSSEADPCDGTGEECVDGKCVCDEGYTANGGECTANCAPQCDGKTCGDDGCDGVCGTCDGFDDCVNGNCEPCVPVCDQVDCGHDDTCGGECGCANGYICNEGGQCTYEDDSPPCDPIDCDDGDDCTTDVCDGGNCIHEYQMDGCTISGACYADGDLNGANECQVCDSAESPSFWSYVADGAVCDGGAGTCQAGSCATCDPEEAGNCVIDGACYAHGAINGANECQECDYGGISTTWTDVVDGTLCDGGAGTCQAGSCQATCDSDCDDGQACTTDTCVDGACEYQLNAGFCVIDSTCRADGDFNGANECQVCDSAVSAISWTKEVDGTACTGGTCIEGACELDKVQVCEPNADACHGEFKVLCNESGDGYAKVTEDCSSEGGGTCKMDEIGEPSCTCTPGASYCDGNSVWQCGSDGVPSWNEDCSGTGYCMNGGCAAYPCDGGWTDGDCIDNIALVCQGMSAVPLVDHCGAQGLTCVADDPQGMGWAACECTPDESYCEDSTTRAVCDEWGWPDPDNTSDCGSWGAICVDGECVPLEPKPPGDGIPCDNPGGYVCEGDLSFWCPGSGFIDPGSEPLQDCAFFGQICVDGACQNGQTVCEPNTSYCDGNSQALCNAQGTGNEHSEPCPAATVCFQSDPDATPTCIADGDGDTCDLGTPIGAACNDGDPETMGDICLKGSCRGFIRHPGQRDPGNPYKFGSADSSEDPFLRVTYAGGVWWASYLDPLAQSGILRLEPYQLASSGAFMDDYFAVPDTMITKEGDLGEYAEPYMALQGGLAARFDGTLWRFDEFLYEWTKIPLPLPDQLEESDLRGMWATPTSDTPDAPLTRLWLAFNSEGSSELCACTWEESDMTDITCDPPTVLPDYLGGFQAPWPMSGSRLCGTEPCSFAVTLVGVVDDPDDSGNWYNDIYRGFSDKGGPLDWGLTEPLMDETPNSQRAQDLFHSEGLGGFRILVGTSGLVRGSLNPNWSPDSAEAANYDFNGIWAPTDESFAAVGGSFNNDSPEPTVWLLDLGEVDKLTLSGPNVNPAGWSSISLMVDDSTGAVTDIWGLDDGTLVAVGWDRGPVYQTDGFGGVDLVPLDWGQTPVAWVRTPP